MNVCTIQSQEKKLQMLFRDNGHTGQESKEMATNSNSVPDQIKNLGKLNSTMKGATQMGPKTPAD